MGQGVTCNGESDGGDWDFPFKYNTYAAIILCKYYSLGCVWPQYFQAMNKVPCS